MGTAQPSSGQHPIQSSQIAHLNGGEGDDRLTACKPIGFLVATANGTAPQKRTAVHQLGKVAHAGRNCSGKGTGSEN